MLLQRLIEYSDRLDLPPPLYKLSPVRYIIDLDIDGTVRLPQPTDTADPSNKRTKRGQQRLVPAVQRAAGIKPLLLADHAEYTFGLPREQSKPERTEQCHAAYLDLVERCASETEDAGVAAVYAFLQNDPLSQLALPEDFDRGGAITFRVANRFVTDSRAVQRFWAKEHRPQADDKGVRVMQCLVCGEKKPALERMLSKIKGIPGGQTSGTALISANASAFESYGLHASQIAPTCADCAERFTKALNSLLSQPETHYYLSSVMIFTFWTREESSFFLSDFMDAKKPGEIRQLIQSVRKTQFDPKLEPTHFYALSLSASGSRAVVRDWIDTTVGHVKQNLGQWFAAQEIVGYDGEPSDPLGLYALAAGTVRDMQKDLPPSTARILLRAAISKTPLPWGLLHQAIRRNRAEQGVNRQRAALIKLVLTYNNKIEEDKMVQIDFDFEDPGYLCGRLLAVLERAQTAAIPGIKATIVDRFYGTASSAPQTVFPRLVRGAQAHFSKLRRDKPGTEKALQRQCEEIMGKLPPRYQAEASAGVPSSACGIRTNFPTALTPEQQGFFALGYYHQRAWSRLQAKEAGERKQAAKKEDVLVKEDVILS